MKIPKPHELDFPEKFEDWRDNQEDAISNCVGAKKRVTVISAPTGFGKSPLVVATARLSGEPTCIVTNSRGLQNQYMDDFSASGMVDLRGRNNYICSLKQDEHFSCAEGYNARCPYKGTHMCPSSQAEMRASISNLVVTNYDKWTANRKFGQGLNHIKHVIFDEGHAAPEALARAMQVTLNHKEIEETLGIDFLGGTECEEFREWKTWAIVCRAVAENALLDARRKITGTVNPKTAWIKHYCHMRNLVRRLATVATAAAKDWVVDQVDNGFQFDPIRPGRYAEAALLLHVPKITMVSATITPKTLFMTGIGRANFDFYEYDSSFDPKRGPIYYVPTLKVKGMGQDLSPIWALLDRIIAKRTGQLGRNGIVHTISYDRQQDLYNQSRFFERMITNDRGEAPTEKIELFKSQQGRILVSPSVGTGYDFPDCLSPDTKVLKSNLEYTEVGNLSVGDKLLGFDEITPRGHKTKQWMESVVLHSEIAKRPCRLLTLADGTQFVCSENHPWLVASSARRAFRWVVTKNIKAVTQKIVRYLDYWEEDNTWEAGYLAGMWDGEGHISQRANTWNDTKKDQAYVSLGMAQTQNCALDLTLSLLRKKGFDPKIYWSKYPNNPNLKDKASVQILGRAEMLRFLGQIRPSRMLEKMDLNKIGSPKSAVQIPVLSNVPIGDREVCLLTTSTKTYIARGFASHNSECRYQFVAKVPFEPPSKIQAARQEADNEYVYYRAWQYLVQAFGRDVRSETDWSERFIGDKQMSWMRSKYGHLAPKSFHAVFKTVDILPQPLHL